MVIRSLTIKGRVLMASSGAWIIVPTYLIYVFGKEIVEGLEVAAEGGKKAR